MRRIYSRGREHKRRMEGAQHEESRDLSSPGLFEGLSRFRSEFDQLMERFLGRSWGPPSRTMREALEAMPWGGGPWTPTVEVAESDREFTVRAELPGVDPKEIELSLSGGRLVLSGEKKEERQEKGKAVFRSERRFGFFRRAIPLPAGADPERIRAEYEKGVLVVHVEKSEDLKPKRIQIISPPKKE